MSEDLLRSQLQTDELQQELQEELILDQAEDSLISSSYEEVKSDELLDQITEKQQNQQESSLTQLKSFKWKNFLTSFSINLFLPFINGLMLGFGEIIAHEIGFKYNWIGSKIYRPTNHSKQKELNSNSNSYSYSNSKYL